ncbi:CPBP family intramembrane glutamic endopeptidase [Actinomadura violacea]|uniref:CPBP family intramembrane metalloprotease n=1 Tax=Actinomadura violacea TaxID=2819934 RepID=A0ABS3RJF9_9ACTN|nr:type II CAAX endopeptidase family protein [Actinomadura violacea]MBO2456219.1 CPBP family intramembrane metalloprotease [Actinomadura violacea]
MTTSLPAPAASPYRRDLIIYLAIAFGLAWVSWAAAIALGGSVEDQGSPAYQPYVLGAFSPLIGALVIRVRRRRRGEPAPAHAVATRRATLAWAPLLLLLAAAIVLAGALIAHQAGGPAITSQDAKDAVDKTPGLPVFLFGILLTGPLSEEPGWRGTMLPRMRASMGRVRAALLLGVIWSVWHLPLFFIDGSRQHKLGLSSPSGLLFAVSVLPMCLLTVAAYERAGIVASMAVHFGSNLTMVLLDVHAPVTMALIIGIQAIAASALLAAARSRYRTPAAAPAGA